MQAGIGRYFLAHYHSALDMLYRLIRNIHFARAQGVTMSPIMDGKKVVIMTSQYVHNMLGCVLTMVLLCTATAMPTG